MKVFGWILLTLAVSGVIEAGKPAMFAVALGVAGYALLRAVKNRPARKRHRSTAKSAPAEDTGLPPGVQVAVETGEVRDAPRRTVRFDG
jgi:hypothetical protein